MQRSVNETATRRSAHRSLRLRRVVAAVVVGLLMGTLGVSSSGVPEAFAFAQTNENVSEQTLPDNAAPADDPASEEAVPDPATPAEQAELPVLPEPTIAPDAPELPEQVQLDGTLLVVPHEREAIALTAGEDAPAEEELPDATGGSYTLITGDGAWVDLGEELPLAAGVEAASGQPVSAVVDVPVEVQDAAAVRVAEEELSLSGLEVAGLVAETAVDLDLALPASAIRFEEIPVAAAPAAHSVDVMVYTRSGATAPTQQQLTGPFSRLSTFWRDETGGEITGITLNRVVQGGAQSWTCDYLETWKRAAAALGDSSGNTWGAGNTRRHLVVILPQSACPGSAAAGWGTIGAGVHSGGFTWVTVPDQWPAEFWDGTLFHEIGHNLSLGHSNRRSCAAPNNDGPRNPATGAFTANNCTDAPEYADSYDVMGAGLYLQGAAGQPPVASNLNNVAALNLSQKARLGTLGSSIDRVNIGNTPTFERVVTLPASSNTSGIRGLEVTDPRTGEKLYVEYRAATGRDQNSLYAKWPGYASSYPVDPLEYTRGVRVLRQVQPATNNQAALWGSAVLQRHAGQKRYSAMQAGHSIKSYGGAVTITTVSLSATTAQVKIGFYESFTTAPTPVVSVSGGGTAWVGKTLTATGAADSNWVPAATSVKYQWYRNGAPISWGTTASYETVAADRGAVLTVSVTPVKDGYRSIPTTSAGVTVGGPTVNRIAGADRMLTAVEISKRAYPTTSEVVYLATGWNFPDALAAAPAAAKLGGPLLLVPGQPAQIPQEVIARVQQLKPKRVVVIGSESVIPNSVVQVFRAAMPALPADKFERIAGATRYETGNALVKDAFPSPVAEVFVATGNNFPDALTAAGIAGSKRVPVVLVNGGAATLDPASLKVLQGLAPSSGTLKVTIVGSATAVSEGIAQDLRAAKFNVSRVSGADRFQTSIELNRVNFTAAMPEVYLATGSGYADALAGAVLTANKRAPLYVVQQGCIPREVLTRVAEKQSTSVTLIGGVPALNADVAAFRRCP